MKRLLLVLGLAFAVSSCSGYDPCEDKTCGDPCSICDPDDADCVETAIFKVCSERLLCAPAPSACG